MGKKSRTKPTGKKTDLGRSLIKGKRQQNRTKVGEDCWRHTSELQDGADWGRLNLQSVTEQSNLADFLMTAEMAGKEFTAEKQDVKIIGRDSFAGVPKPEEITRLKRLQEENQQFLTIPRRPPWDASTSAEQLELSERESFLRWRRSLSQFQESRDELIVTPYERNLNVWRQLWRVVERVDVVCQIVDARNPLLFTCADLKRYVQEIDPDKGFLLLINKSDYLSEQQRRFWAEYFDRQNMNVLFWSALDETDVDDNPQEVPSDLQMNDDEDGDESDGDEDEDEANEEDDGVDEEDDDDEDDEDCIDEGRCEDEDEHDSADHLDLEMTSDDYRNTTLPVTGVVVDDSVGNDNNNLAGKLCVSPSDRMDSEPYESVAGTSNSSSLMKRMELVEFFRTCKRTKHNVDRDYATVGLVGYPNVGKSSTINALLQTKKTAVSATPGKTKHFQTLFLGDDLQLCDCPGLVFPTFVTTKAEMVLNGILPIDQIIDYVAPVNQLAHLIPRSVVESTYGINIPPPGEGEVPDRSPTAEELLSSYASMRGFMTSNGQPDCPRASRYILKDFIKGKLLYRLSPPGVADSDYECVGMSVAAEERFSIRLERSAKKKSEGKEQLQYINEKDEDFFSEEPRHVPHLRRPAGPMGNEQQQTPLDGLHKPWKKHGNKNKKEKLRRLFKDN